MLSPQGRCAESMFAIRTLWGWVLKHLRRLDKCSIAPTIH